MCLFLKRVKEVAFELSGEQCSLPTDMEAHREQHVYKVMKSHFWSLNSKRFIVPNKIRKGRFRDDFERHAKVLQTYSGDGGSHWKLLSREAVESCRSLKLFWLLLQQRGLCSPHLMEAWPLWEQPELGQVLAGGQWLSGSSLRVWAGMGSGWDQSEQWGFDGHREGRRTRTGSGASQTDNFKRPLQHMWSHPCFFIFQLSFNLHLVKYTNHKCTAQVSFTYICTYSTHSDTKIPAFSAPQKILWFFPVKKSPLLRNHCSNSSL